MVAFKFVWENMRRFNKNVQEILNGKYVKAWTDEIYSILRFGCSPDDYFRYEFYRKSNFEKNKFITYRRSKKIIKKYNDPEKVDILNNKVKFNMYFSHFIQRDWMEIDTATADELELFCEKHNSLIVKPVGGGQGHGIFIWNKDDITSRKVNLHDCSGYIAEEILIQHPEMESLNPTSVNTVRVLTFKGEVIAAALRIGGSGAIVDNLHSNGVCGHIDIQNGIIDVPCIDMKFNKYVYHPSTHKKLVGFEIPLWSLVVEKVKEAALVVPEVQYIGWDVAILKNSVALIEGNHDPGHDVVQMIGQTGLYQDILRCVHNK